MVQVVKISSLVLNCVSSKEKRMQLLTRPPSHAPLTSNAGRRRHQADPIE